MRPFYDTSNCHRNVGCRLFDSYRDRMGIDAGALSERIAEARIWCSVQDLTASHQDSPDEARRRKLGEEASQLLAAHYRKRDGWLQHFLPDNRLWDRAMNLLKEADLDSLAPLEHQLRSSALKPPDSIGSSYSEESRQQIVNRVVDLRAFLTKSRGLPPPDSTDRTHGRLLLYTPCENVSDGASRFASSGFFDPNDCPPWDIWLQYVDRTLISWVPEALFPLAQAGIDGNVVECIKWAD